MYKTHFPKDPHPREQQKVFAHDRPSPYSHLIGQVEGGRADVLLRGNDSVLLEEQVGGRDNVAPFLVGIGGGLHRDVELEAAIEAAFEDLGDRPGGGGFEAGAFFDSGEGAVAAESLVAADTRLGGLAGTGAEGDEVVAVKMLAGWLGLRLAGLILTCTESYEEGTRRRSWQRRRPEGRRQRWSWQRPERRRWR